MKLEDYRFQFVVLQDHKIGIEDIVRGETTELAAYSLPSDILHISLLGEYRNGGFASIPRISADRMSKLFGKQIIAVYLELP